MSEKVEKKEEVLGLENDDEVETKKQTEETSESKNNEVETKESENEEEDLELDDDNGVEYIIESKEGKIFKLKGRREIQLSGLLKDTFQESDKSKPVKMREIPSHTLGQIVDYLKHHKGKVSYEIPKPLESSDLKDVKDIDKWDVNFVDIPKEELFHLLLASNYMQITPLLCLCCAKLASLMKGKTPEKIRKLFNIEDNYTKEEEEEVKKMHKELLE